METSDTLWKAGRCNRASTVGDIAAGGTPYDAMPTRDKTLMPEPREAAKIAKAVTKER